jgi:hypothetical protein
MDVYGTLKDTTWQEEWIYALDDVNHVIELESYNRDETDIKVYNYAIKNGIRYQTKLKEATKDWIWDEELCMNLCPNCQKELKSNT